MKPDGIRTGIGTGTGTTTSRSRSLSFSAQPLPEQAHVLEISILTCSLLVTEPRLGLLLRARRSEE